MRSRAVLPDSGRLVADGLTNDVVGNCILQGRLLHIEVRRDGQGARAGIKNSVAVEVVLKVNTERPSAKLQVGFELLDSHGVEVLQTLHTDAASPAVLAGGVHRLSCSIPEGLPNAGHCAIHPSAALFCEKWLISRADEAARRFDGAFDHPNSEMRHQARSGLLALCLEWRQALLPGTAPRYV